MKFSPSRWSLSTKSRVEVWKDRGFSWDPQNTLLYFRWLRKKGQPKAFRFWLWTLDWGLTNGVNYWIPVCLLLLSKYILYVTHPVWLWRLHFWVFHFSTLELLKWTNHKPCILDTSTASLSFLLVSGGARRPSFMAKCFKQLAPSQYSSLLEFDDLLDLQYK